MTITVLIADDQALIRSGLRAIIESEPGMEVVGDQDFDAHGASCSGRGIDASTSNPPLGRAPVRRVPP